jgi:hypothetical protein
MPDNLKRKGPEDPNFVNIHETWELNYWSGHFGVTKEKVIEAVKRVGPSVVKVRQYLGK